MTFQELIIQSHSQLYENGGEDLENLRFFANLTMILAQRLQAQVPTSEEDMLDMIKTAHAIEKELKARG